jgi:predicted alpha/beta-hydrolase family hydrolase
VAGLQAKLGDWDSTGERMVSEAQQWRVSVDGDETSALFEPATNGETRFVFVCGHGAGGHMRERGIERLAALLRGCGIGVVRFNFLYCEHGSRRPDPMPRLKACMRAVIEHARAALQPGVFLIGGRSMGGRTGSMLVAEGLACDALLLLAYPLHPAGQPEKLRDAHLPDIRVPVLCFNGTRDTLCRQDLMERVISPLADWKMHWLEGADHSFRVLKSSGRTDAEVLTEIGDASARWISRF